MKFSIFCLALAIFSTTVLSAPVPPMFRDLAGGNAGNAPKVLDLHKLPGIAFTTSTAKAGANNAAFNAISNNNLLPFLNQEVGACGANQIACGPGCCSKYAKCCHKPGSNTATCCTGGQSCCTAGNVGYCYSTSSQRCCPGGPCARSNSCCGDSLCCSSSYTCCDGVKCCGSTTQHCCQGKCCSLSQMCCSDGTCKTSCNA